MLLRHKVKMCVNQTAMAVADTREKQRKKDLFWLKVPVVLLP